MQTFIKTIGSILMIGLLLLTAACDSNDSSPELSGRWSGNTVIEGEQVSISVLLTENNGAITGNGTLIADESYALTVTGTHNFPSVSLTISTDVFESFSFSGTLTSDENAIAGSLNGSGVQNLAIEMRRQ